MDGFIFVGLGTFREFVMGLFVLSSIMGVVDGFTMLPSVGMLLGGGFVMATFDKFVIIKRVKTLRASTQLVERERGESLEIEKSVRNAMTRSVIPS
jgi:hypothetical protein